MHRHLALLLAAIGHKIGSRCLHLAHIRLALLCRSLCLRCVTKRNMCPEQERKHFLIEFLEHLAEEVEALELIDKKRVFLLVCSILYRLLQIVHITEMLLPLLVYLPESYRLAKGSRKFLSFSLIRLLEVY